MLLTPEEIIEACEPRVAGSLLVEHIKGGGYAILSDKQLRERDERIIRAAHKRYLRSIDQYYDPVTDEAIDEIIAAAEADQ